VAESDKKSLDPMISSAIARLQEIGPKWRTDEAAAWSDMFTAIVMMVYPGREPRKRRKDAKPDLFATERH
jgi:hypothetical protein